MAFQRLQSSKESEIEKEERKANVEEIKVDSRPKSKLFYNKTEIKIVDSLGTSSQPFFSLDAIMEYVFDNSLVDFSFGGESNLNSFSSL